MGYQVEEKETRECFTIKVMTLDDESNNVRNKLLSIKTINKCIWAYTLDDAIQILESEGYYICD